MHTRVLRGTTPPRGGAGSSHLHSVGPPALACGARGPHSLAGASGQQDEAAAGPQGQLVGTLRVVEGADAPEGLSRCRLGRERQRAGVAERQDVGAIRRADRSPAVGRCAEDGNCGTCDALGRLSSRGAGRGAGRAREHLCFASRAARRPRRSPCAIADAPAISASDSSTAARLRCIVATGPGAVPGSSPPLCPAVSPPDGPLRAGSRPLYVKKWFLRLTAQVWHG